jgi:hypothetical protein
VAEEVHLVHSWIADLDRDFAPRTSSGEIEMEGPVWMQLFAQAVASLSSLFASSNNPSAPSSGTASQGAPASDVTSTSTSTSATSLLRVTRNQKTMDGVFGYLDFNEERLCFTMENLALAIPAGQYPIEIYDSPHAGHPVPLLQNIPGRDFVEIHCGNVPCDSKGCIIVGLDHIEDTLERSRDAFNLLFPKIEAALKLGPQQIEIADAN